MKIIQIATFPLDSSKIQGGVEASVYGLAIELALHHEVMVCDLPRAEVLTDTQLAQNGLNIARFASRSRNNLGTLSRLSDYIRFVRQQQPDICHIHTTTLFCLAVYLCLRFHKIPCAVTVHGLAHIEKRNLLRQKKNFRNRCKFLLYSLTEFIFLSLCHEIIVDTQYVADAIAAYAREGKLIRQPHCTVIPQGIDECFFGLQTEPQEGQLIAVATLHKRKGHLLLLRAMELVHAACPHATLSIYGALSDREYYESMLELVREKKMESYVGIYPNTALDTLLKAYQRADLFVLHSEEESQGIVLCEAMAAGIPIVATNTGGIPWVVKDGINGLLSDFGDVETFAAHIIALQNDSNSHARFASVNQTEAQKYSWKTITANIESLYAEILAKTDKKRANG